MVNGSPTKEFDIKRGVRQGDPLSPFLFVLAMEGLSASLKEACCKHLFHGISLPNNGPMVSHLMYADDVTFIGEWSEVNFINLNRILRCFYLASGLKVNLAKSRVFGIGIEEIEITRLAGILHCEPATFPFVYLGLPIGANMKLAKNWKPIMDKFNSKLSSWKAKNLSFGGRLTLLKSVLGSLPLYYFSIFKAPLKVIGSLESIRRRFLWSGSDDKRKINWVAWNVVTAPKSSGGLGVGCLNSLNIALLSKWWWRLKSEKYSFWGSCIKAIHGLKGVDGESLAKRGIPGIWLTISQVKETLLDWNVSLDSLAIRLLGKGNSTFFWKDKWCGNDAFKNVFPDLYKVESDKNCLVAARVSAVQGGSVGWCWKRRLRNGIETKELEVLHDILRDIQLREVSDSWKWAADPSGHFTVRSIRCLLNQNRLDNRLGVDFKWVNWVPIKVNCFAWRLLCNRIPVASNLVIRGVAMDSADCKICGGDVEDGDHLFFACPFARQVWVLFSKWSGCFSCVLCSSSQLFEVLKGASLDGLSLKLKRALIYTAIWCIWKARNLWIFHRKKCSPALIFDDIQLSSFNWIKYRSKLSSLSWFSWINSLCSSM